MLSKEEIRRYNRHIIMPEVGLDGQEKLKVAKVLVIGAGGLGCPVLLYLTAAGVGTLGIVDDDVVDESNLQRQVLFSTEDIGKKKVSVTQLKLQAQNPEVKVILHPERLTAVNALEIFKNYDFIIDGSDNFPTRYLVNDACVILNKPLVFGSIFKFEGQVSVFNYKNGPTYRCLFPQPPNAAESPSCSQIGVIGVLPGMIGTMMTNEAIKLILGKGKLLSGRLFIINTLTFETQIVSFEKNLACANVSALIDYEEFCSAKAKEIKKISVEDFNKLVAAHKEFQLIDVREPWEYSEVNMNGENIPLNTLESSINRISGTKQIIIHCKSGGRSCMAIDLLQTKFGFTNLYNLTGGIEAWNKQQTVSTPRADRAL